MARNLLIILTCIVAISEAFQRTRFSHKVLLKSAELRPTNMVASHRLVSQFRLFGGTDKKPETGSRFMKDLPIISFIVGIIGVSFQVFVLYPWHEELSYEFKDLEASIIRLDRTLEAQNPSVNRMTLNRITDKYVKVNAEFAGPKVSKYLPVLPTADKDEIDKGQKADEDIIKEFNETQ
jgi:hypothetical protein